MRIKKMKRDPLSNTSLNSYNRNKYNKLVGFKLVEVKDMSEEYNILPTGWTRKRNNEN